VVAVSGVASTGWGTGGVFTWAFNPFREGKITKIRRSVFRMLDTIFRSSWRIDLLLKNKEKRSWIVIFD
jgi:hypothetical protein